MSGCARILRGGRNDPEQWDQYERRPILGDQPRSFATRSYSILFLLKSRSRAGLTQNKTTPRAVRARTHGHKILSI